MKKIVALALCLIMALSLATVAFGATGTAIITKAEAGKLYVYDNENDVLYDGVAASKVAAKAATASKKGNIAYYAETATPANVYVEVAETKADAAYYTGSKLVYLKPVTCVEYDTSSYVFAYEAGKTTKCGEVTGVYDAVFTKTDAAGNTTKHTAVDANDTGASTAYGTPGFDFILYDGTIYAVNTAAATAAAKTHTWEAKTYDEDGVTATVICSDCGATGKVVTAAEYATAAAAVKVGVAATFPYVILTSAAATTTSGVTSAKTFDAGVALYAGMALMSVAGSAVVIGKKKEF